DLVDLPLARPAQDWRRPHQDLTVIVDLDVVQTIEEGTTADVLVKVGRINLLQKTFDICNEARNANAIILCPVEPGAYQIVQTVEFPKEPSKCAF
ncbi:hypothetical protein DFH08DRAFT_646037, partial [Mycena albidolilacea]